MCIIADLNIVGGARLYLQFTFLICIKKNFIHRQYQFLLD